jgi:putative PIN family toxin of toxin-antitoxin system
MLPLRLVIDTNVLVSAAIKPAGLPERAAACVVASAGAACRSAKRTVLLLGITKPARLYVSRPILEEYSEGLSRPELQIRKGLRQQLLQLIKNHCYTVAPTRLLEVTSDPDDNMFRECADTARADYLVTGNQKHFPRFWKKTKVITTREFISLVAPHLIK